MAKTGYRHPLWQTEARPNQRTFVARSESLDGPWHISDGPIIEPAKTITTLTVNPAVCRRPEGDYLMIVKGDKPDDKGFVRNQALATAPAPEGPWTIRNKPVIDYLDTEDASIWYDQTRERYYAVFHAHGFIGMITSEDGINRRAIPWDSRDATSRRRCSSYELDSVFAAGLRQFADHIALEGECPACQKHFILPRRVSR